MDRFGVETIQFFGWLFLGLTSLQVLLLAGIANPLKRVPALYLLVLLAPGLVLFPAYDPDAYLRKDIFITLGLLLHASVVTGLTRATTAPARYTAFLRFGLAPYLLVATFIHENQLFFLPAHALLAYAAHGYPPLRRHALAVLLPVFGPAVAAAALAIRFRGHPEASDVICKSWEAQAPIQCDAIVALSRTYSETVRLYLAPLVHSRTEWVFYPVLSVLVLVPPLAVRRYLKAQGAALVPGRLVASAILPALVLFALGWDWGRWMHMIGVSLTCLVMISVPADVPAVKDDRARALGLALALLYTATWSLKHCCIPRPISPAVLLVLRRTGRLLMDLVA